MYEKKLETRLLPMAEASQTIAYYEVNIILFSGDDLSGDGRWLLTKWENKSGAKLNNY